MGICSRNLIEAFAIMLAPITFGTIVMYPSPTKVQILAEHGLGDSDIRWSFYNSVSSLFAIAGPFLSRGLLYAFKVAGADIIMTLGGVQAIASMIVLGKLSSNEGITNRSAQE